MTISNGMSNTMVERQSLRNKNNKLSTLGLGVGASRSTVFCIVFCLYVHPVFELTGLPRITASDYPFGIVASISMIN